MKKVTAKTLGSEFGSMRMPALVYLLNGIRYFHCTRHTTSNRVDPVNRSRRLYVWDEKNLKKYSTVIGILMPRFMSPVGSRCHSYFKSSGTEPNLTYTKHIIILIIIFACNLNVTIIRNNVTTLCKRRSLFDDNIIITINLIVVRNSRLIAFDLDVTLT